MMFEEVRAPHASFGHSHLAVYQHKLMPGYARTRIAQERRGQKGMPGAPATATAA
jgi:hypothetical protein